jgi:hypothetical protein
VDKASLETQVLHDLEKSGFGAEMRAAKTVLDCGWQLDVCRRFDDTDEGKSRELDIPAWRALTAEHLGWTVYSHFQIVGEVKKSDKPWVVFREPYVRSSDLEIAWSGLVFSDLPHGQRGGELYAAISTGLADHLGWIGYGIHEAFKRPDQPSRSYAAMITACKASEHMLDGNSWDLSEDSNSSCAHIYYFQPTVILEGELMAAWLDASADIHVESVPMASVFFEFGSSTYRRCRYHVNLVRLDSLREYIGLCQQQHDRISAAHLAALRQR